MACVAVLVAHKQSSTKLHTALQHLKSPHPRILFFLCARLHTSLSDTQTFRTSLPLCSRFALHHPAFSTTANTRHVPRHLTMATQNGEGGRAQDPTKLSKPTAAGPAAEPVTDRKGKGKAVATEQDLKAAALDMRMMRRKRKMLLR